MRRRHIGFACLVLLSLSLLSAGVGAKLGDGILHPPRRFLDAAAVHHADELLARLHATREEIEVSAPDSVRLRGWKVHPRQPNDDWVMLLHGVSDNRAGMLSHAEILLRQGFTVLMMDSRSHGDSEGARATYGWLERRDTRSITEALFASARPHCFFLLGESMGAAIALQSAAVEPRVDGVVAESAFANLREVSYDYAGLWLSPWLGRTLFRPAAIVGMDRAEIEGGFRAEAVSPETAVQERIFPVLLICGSRDHRVPARHSGRIYAAAKGPKDLWFVSGAGHSTSLGTAPDEFERRVIAFFEKIHRQKQTS